MYEEEKNSINWFKVVLRLVIVLLVILLSIKLITIILNNKTNVKESNVMDQSLKQMEKVAKDYFKDDNLPDKIGSSKEVTLEELINEKLIDEIKDASGNKCDTKKSYIKVTKLDKEYRIKSNLVCGDKEEYSDTYINNDTTTTTTKKATTTTKKTTTSTSTTKTTTSQNNTTVKTTKKTTTVAKKQYTISFNTNGGTQLSSQTIIENGTMKYVVPTRSGYTFAGWYYHGTKFDINTKINQDYVLTAKWIVG